METISIHKPKVVVIGSCNTDMVVKANRLPVPGETVLGGTFYMNPGGKGSQSSNCGIPIRSRGHFHFQNRV